MQLTLDVKQDIKRFVAVAGISLAFIVAQTTPALAATDTDRDGLINGIERNVTETNPRDADTDDDRIKDSLEDEDLDGIDNIDEDDLDDDNDGVEDEDDEND